MKTNILAYYIAATARWAILIFLGYHFGVTTVMLVLTMVFLDYSEQVVERERGWIQKKKVNLTQELYLRMAAVFFVISIILYVFF